MKHPSITITGSILAADILNAIEKNDGIPGQNDKDFGLEKGGKAKDLIARTYADARFYWMGFKKQMERLDKEERDLGTTETRKFWTIPFLTMLGYDPLYAQSAARVQDKTYAISHRDHEIDQFPIHIVGYKDSLDSKVPGRLRMSPHAMLQEYLNLTEHLYGIVTNGLQIRLLRDSSRLVKLSYLEFDLERMFEEEHYADFALLFRLLHRSRMPQSQDTTADCLIEEYHQRALASGSRIRDGLSMAVESSIKLLGNGFLRHHDNEELRLEIKNGNLVPKKYYNWLLRLIYRMLFLMVIEERHLVYDKNADDNKRRIYFDYYSLQRLRKLSEHRFLADRRFQDYWQALKQTFRLFEAGKYGAALDLKPLAGGLFGQGAIGLLNTSRLDNATLLQVLRTLNAFTHPDTKQKIRVNYGALNVEEFGSVYEGLLEYQPAFYSEVGMPPFDLIPGDDRSNTGSHYTPDKLVVPLIEHSLDYVINDKLEEAGWVSGTKSPEVCEKAERALLSITVCDVACGSGHILLNAARRIALHLALIQTGAEQPSPEAQRRAIRQVIRHCIYGVDLNPLAVELCKVALWLEAHNPGEPLNFLDHHIKCGNAIVGAGRLEDLMEGIPDEAFNSLTGFSKEEKEVAGQLRRTNKKERQDRIKRKQLVLHAKEQAQDTASRMAARLQEWAALPEHSPSEVETKAQAYHGLINSEGWQHLKQLANIQAAQFFLPKKETSDFVTDRDFYAWLNQDNIPNQERVKLALGIADKKRFFHWFWEFPEVFVKGGFDCILGNPPFLGGKMISKILGLEFGSWIKFEFPTTGSSDLVGYFFRRVFEIIKENGFLSLISTNSIAQGDTRTVSLDYIVGKGGVINHAVRSTRWPGTASVEVSLVTIYKGFWKKPFILNGEIVQQVTTFLDDQVYLGEPFKLIANENKSFQGSIILGKGFILEASEAKAIIKRGAKNKEILFPYLNGRDLNNNIDQSPSRFVIDFKDWPKEKAEKYKICWDILLEKVKPQRDVIVARGKQIHEYDFWKFWDRRPTLYKTISPFRRVLVHSRVTKTHAFAFLETNIVFSEAVVIFAYQDYKDFAILQASPNEQWAWLYSSTLKGDRRYSPSDAFENYPFPISRTENDDQLEHFGKQYYKKRQVLLDSIQLGLTKAYNQFHNEKLTTEIEDLPSNNFKKRYGKESWNLYNHLEKKKAGKVSFQEAVPMIEELRRLHKEMDETVLAAYGWEDIQFRHDFYEVDYLPEKDNIRYTIHPDARKEVLKRLLLLNHERYEEEVRQGLHGKKAKQKTKVVKKKKKEENEAQGRLF